MTKSRNTTKPKRFINYGKRKNLKQPIRNFKNKKVIKTLIKKEINRHAETKQSYVEPVLTSYNTQTSNSFGVLPNITQTNFYQIFPEISQGSSEQNRIGNKIEAKGLYVKGHLSTIWPNIVSNNSSFQTMYVRILCLSDKIYPVDSIAYGGFPTSYNQLLQKGNTATNFLFSDQTSLYRPVNTDRFTVHYDKVIKLGSYSANLGTANVDQINGLHRFSYKVPMKSMLKYNDTESRPTNINMPFMLIGYCPGDNYAITSGATTQFVRCSYYSDFYYKDE